MDIVLLLVVSFISLLILLVALVFVDLLAMLPPWMGLGFVWFVAWVGQVAALLAVMRG